MNKRLKKKKLLNFSFELKNLKSSKNCGDHSISYSGELYKGNTLITSFYEHPIEGGFFPNGEPSNKIEYFKFLNMVMMSNFKTPCNNNQFDECKLFDKGISELMNTFNYH